MEDLKSFNDSAKQEAGYQLDQVQRGHEPTDWKPMKSIGSGVQEIRMKDNQGIYRVIYVAKYLSTVFVLHAFQKKTRKTAKSDIDLAKTRLKEVLKKVNL